ncbi:galactokinase [Gluconobacter wancherniae]|uniref:Galactokinase n=1 Tax=Gluconobacter wancherniae NBRC 103581 TaxID=656744 RepID=A0A511B0K5_9PROT|nr:galactokinase [Gluconobacter wancherniae]MBF0854183.1 galactokinase [Gluconobacter wancherniae]GBD57240.1 galactokinase [Gluconobacter wancherniae NBRC 103581]GBR65441.1 galactokinase [Gluconobacter wancherniae NBRC 103581]GEK93986.1 galactokinase [Gluconobacter wancherniae NBRC 103581]
MTSAHHDTTTSPAIRVREGFEVRFGIEPELVVQAPGRVNLIGEHTDYNDGFVLPCAIDFQNTVAVSRRVDDQVHVVALEMNDEEDSFSLSEAVPPAAEHGWSDYVRGAVEILRRRGYRLCGLNMAIAGNVPQGAGLSSSASLLVALITAMKLANNLSNLDAKQVAVAAREVETDYVGVNCGIMDQMISACGEDGHALKIDCRSLETTPVVLDPDLAILIVHSGVARGLVESEYNQRRKECEQAAAFFGAPALRDVSLKQLVDSKGKLAELPWKRAHHIITDSARVLESETALQSGNTKAIREIFSASHASMRDDFQITTPKIDELVEIVQDAISDKGGARMTGGGFGGCIVAVMKRDVLPAAIAAVQTHYIAPNGKPALCFACSPSQGAGQIH